MTKPTVRLVQPAKTQVSLHISSLIRVLADRMFLLQPPGNPKRDKQEILPNLMAIQVFAGHTGLIVGLSCTGS